MIHPILASGALQFAFEKATLEGKITIGALLLLSLFSWTIIISKIRQLFIATKWSKRFLAAYAETRDPLDLKRKNAEFDGSPAYELYARGAEELEYHHRPLPAGQCREGRAGDRSLREPLIPPYARRPNTPPTPEFVPDQSPDFGRIPRCRRSVAHLLRGARRLARQRASQNRRRNGPRETSQTRKATRTGKETGGGRSGGKARRRDPNSDAREYAAGRGR